MQIIILISILLIALIYLHIVQDRLIFQPGVITARILLVIALILAAGSKVFGTIMTLIMASSTPREISRSMDSGFVWFTILYDVVVWILVIVAYWKFFEGCRMVAYFKKTDSVDLSLRKKIREILLETYKQAKITPEYKMFLGVCHEDPLVEAIRCECKRLNYIDGQLFKEELEKLKGFAEKLKE